MDKTEQRALYPWEAPQNISGFPPPIELAQPVGCSQPLEDAVHIPAVSPEPPPPAALLPAAPAYVLAHAFQENQATLLWGEARGADGYLLLRGESPGSLKPVAAVEMPSYIDSQVRAGKTYYYAVRAYNEHGQSAATHTATVSLPARAAPGPEPEPPSSVFTGKRLRVQKKPQKQEQALKEGEPAGAAPAVPDAPTDLRAKICGTRLVELQWQGGGQEGVEYRLYRSATPWCCYGLIAETGGCHFLDTVPEAGTKYYYFAQAVLEGRSSAASAMAEALTFPKLPPPEPPERLRAAPVNLDAVELRWAHARGAAAYVIYARMEGEDFQAVGHTLDGGFLHEGLPVDVTVDYRVQSYHDTGVSPAQLHGIQVDRGGAQALGRLGRGQPRVGERLRHGAGRAGAALPHGLGEVVVLRARLRHGVQEAAVLRLGDQPVAAPGRGAPV
ncbi:MAG: hypothetical protein LBB75_03160 [Oscillospiraceae bacterium]|jgi:hypothetical protein|nr:hypothetical protein [Oscillospiraceae bacterium]